MEAGNNTEVTTEQKERQTEEAPKLSRIDALEVAKKTIEDTSHVQGNQSGATASDSGADSGAANESGRADDSSRGNRPPSETIEPPAQWSKEEKAAFFEMDAKGRAAALRIHKAQQQYHSRELERIRAEEAKVREEKEHVEWARKLAEQAEPFVKTRGDKRPTYEQLIDALKLVNEFDSNPKQAAANILRAKGLTPPADWENSDSSATPAIEEKIKPVLDKVSALENELAQAKQIQIAQKFAELGSELQSAKNAAGNPRFPDFNDSESGIALASQMGSLIRGEHQHSAGFAAYLQARVPEAVSNPLKLVEEAYKWFGGKVDDSTEAPRPSDPQRHLLKSNRAASSVPGRGLNGATSTGSPVKKLTRLQALEKAAEAFRN